jgi:hypothetical protein
MSQPEPEAPSTFDLAFTVIALVLIALAVALAFGDFALGAVFNTWQSSILGGRHFPFLTVMVLGITFVVPVFVVKAVIVRMRAK